MIPNMVFVIPHVKVALQNVGRKLSTNNFVMFLDFEISVSALRIHGRRFPRGGSLNNCGDVFIFSDLVLFKV